MLRSWTSSTFKRIEPPWLRGSSIGRIVIPFATEQGIDLRSKSSQVLNTSAVHVHEEHHARDDDRKPVQLRASTSRPAQSTSCPHRRRAMFLPFCSTSVAH